MSYIHITEKETIKIEIYLEEWFSKSKIARKLWRPPSTITREIKNYSNPLNWNYESLYAINKRRNVKSKVNQNNRQRIMKESDLEIFILDKIKSSWTPEQISWRWKMEKKLDSKENKLSKDTIYSYIYKEYPELIKPFFRRKWKKYQNKRREKYQLNDRVNIKDRPIYIIERKTIWNREWDTIIGKNHKWAIFTNVERRTWYLLTMKLDRKSWEDVLQAYIHTSKDIPKNKIKTSTVDNWREFARHKEIERKTNIKIYFADPYCSWQRWTNENTNWLLRWFIPKKTDFSTITKKQLEEFTKSINLRPRKRLWYKTPYEVFWGKKLKFAVRGGM